MKRLACLLLALLMIAGAALAEEPPVYVALGDSITAGYGLSEGEKASPSSWPSRAATT